jgi:hypothetical protein
MATTRFSLPTPSVGSELFSQVITDLASALGTIDTNIPKWVWGVAPTRVNSTHLTLPQTPMSGILLTYQGQVQRPTTDYTVSGTAVTTLTFSVSLTDSVLVYYPY